MIAAFNHDGSRILSASDDSSLSLWETASGHTIRTILQTSDGYACYDGEQDGAFALEHATGDAWRYLFALDPARGEAFPACYMPNWSSKYTA